MRKEDFYINDDGFIVQKSNSNSQYKPQRKDGTGGQTMRKNQFCVNDKVSGSVWGDVTTFEELDKMRQSDSLGEVKFMQVLNEWNGKRYAFMRDEWNGNNYFIEM